MKYHRFPFLIVAALLMVIFQGCSLLSRAPETNVAVPVTGEKLYMAKCGGCHELYAPGKHTADEWGKWVEAMQVRSKITDYEKNLINDYLRGNAKDSFRYH